MKNVLFCVIIAAIVVILTVLPTSVVNVILNVILITIVVLVVLSLPVVLIYSEYTEYKENKARKLRDEQNQLMYNTYSPLCNGLSRWIDNDTLLEVQWCSYNDTFWINYESVWTRHCVRKHIHIDGTCEPNFTIPGYTEQFNNGNDAVIFDDTVDTILERLSNLNK